jgi:hyaluronan synthase
VNITLLAFLFFSFCLVYGILSYFIGFFLGRKIDIKCDYGYQPTVSVIMSSFNEGAAVYKSIQSILASNYPRHLIQIVAFDDCSKDDSWDWLQKIAAEFDNIIIRRNEVNKGKTLTLAEAAALTTGDILISTDSDTIFDVDAIKEMVARFADPRIGAVGGVIGIYNVNDSLLTQMQTVFYATAFLIVKPLENIRGFVQCLGGPLVAFKRSLYMEILPAVLKRNFFGEEIRNGEDRFITQQVLLSGYRTFMSMKAKCWVGTPITWGNFFKQQLRWRRSAVGQYIHAITNISTYLKHAGFISTASGILPLTANFVWLVYLLYLAAIGEIMPVLLALVLIKTFVLPYFGVIFNATIGKRDPLQRLNNPLLSCLFIAIWWSISVLILTPWALFTLDDGGWVTRQNGAKGNI